MGVTNGSCDGYRSPPEIIKQSYVWFTLSLGDLKDLLAERWVTVSYGTVRRGVTHLGPGSQRMCA